MNEEFDSVRTKNTQKNGSADGGMNDPGESNDSYTDHGEARRSTARRKDEKKRHIVRTLLIIALTVVLISIVAVIALFLHFYGLMNTGNAIATATVMPTAQTMAAENNPVISEPIEVSPTDTPLPTPEPPKTEEELLREDLEKNAEKLNYSDDVYNILLIGSDGRVEELERSDSMIVLSINRTTKTIWLTSLMRDCQVTIPNWGLGHLNWCTRYGGIEMLLDTIESPENFGLHIDNWAMVDFLDFVQVAELLAPVTVTVTPEEAEDMNLAIREVCQLIDATQGRQINDPNNIERPYFPTEETGTYTLTNGIQILGYCRERHFGGDTGRSEKQRDVLMQMWDNTKNMSVIEQFKLMEAIFPIISTDLTAGKCASLLLQLPAFLEYKIRPQQCPVEGSFYSALDRLNLSAYNVDYRTNRNFLRATIYNEPLTKEELTSRWLGYPMVLFDPDNPDAPSPTHVPW